MPTRVATTVVAEPDDALAVGPASLTVDDVADLAAAPYGEVRAALAATLGDLGRERAQAPLTGMLRDADQRVIPSVLTALARAGATNAAAEMTARLKSDDPVVRAHAEERLWRGVVDRALETVRWEAPG